MPIVSGIFCCIRFSAACVRSSFHLFLDFVMKFQYFSLGHDVIWAIDDNGKAFCAVGNPLDITTEAFIPDWVHIKDSPSNDLKFQEV